MTYITYRYLLWQRTPGRARKDGAEAGQVEGAHGPGRSIQLLAGLASRRDRTGHGIHVNLVAAVCKDGIVSITLPHKYTLLACTAVQPGDLRK